MSKPEEITHSKILLVEGLDAKIFFIHALVKYGISNIQVFDFGGISQLSQYIRAFRLRSNFEGVEAILIIRDAEENYFSAENSIKTALSNAGFSSSHIPKRSFEFAGSYPKFSYIILPALKKFPETSNGTLEDLCFEIINDYNEDQILCVNKFIEELKVKTNIKFKREHKNRLHVFLSSTNKYVGAKIGEAAKIGAWDWEHEKMQQIKKFLLSL